MNDDIIKKIIIEYHEGSRIEIIDGYAINQLYGILSVVDERDMQSINKLLNEMEVENMRYWYYLNNLHQDNILRLLWKYKKLIEI